MKRVFIFPVLAIVIAGGIFAQENLNETFDIGNVFGFNLMQTSSLNPGFQLDLMSDGRPRTPTGGSPFMAGLMNIPFGLWSWMNGDWWGGAITTAWWAAGIGGMIIASIDGDIIYGLVGVVGIIVAPIYGYRRGSSQYRRMAAASSFAEAIGGNPLERVSLVVFPTFGERKLAGSFTYSVSY
jgi:hypothetical protein